MSRRQPVVYYAYDASQIERFNADRSAPVIIQKAPGAPVWLPPAEADVIVCSLGSWYDAPALPPDGWPFNICYVQFASAGVDSLPVWARGVPQIASARGVTAEPIAEYVMAAILADCKKLDLLSQLAREKPDEASEERCWPAGAMRSLKGTTLGLLGFGAIGQAIARRAEAFGMEVVALRRRGPDGSGRFVGSHEELAARADHLVLCAPATPETRHIIGERVLDALRPHAHLINVGRGALVDHDALLAAISAGRLRQATLDVTEPEPLPQDHPLLHHERVRVTPHAAWFSPDHFDRVTTKVLANLGRYAAGEPLQDLADFERGY